VGLLVPSTIGIPVEVACRSPAQAKRCRRPLEARHLDQLGLCTPSAGFGVQCATPACLHSSSLECLCIKLNEPVQISFVCAAATWSRFYVSTTRRHRSRLATTPTSLYTPSHSFNTSVSLPGALEPSRAIVHLCYLADDANSLSSIDVLAQSRSLICIPLTVM
jgi:hypothetical protein